MNTLNEKNETQHPAFTPGPDGRCSCSICAARNAMLAQMAATAEEDAEREMFGDESAYLGDLGAK